MDKPKRKRIALTVTEDLNARLVELAEIEGKPPAAVVREILIDYLDTNAEEINKAKRAHSTYTSIMKRLRRQQSLFDDEEGI